MGITRSNLHKRTKSGAKQTTFRKKKKYELGRPSSHTKIGDFRVRPVRVRGGNYKSRALRLDYGNFSWGSEGCATKSRIVNVVYNATNNEFVRTNTLTKGTIVLVDAAPFRKWYERYYNEKIAHTTTELREESSLNDAEKAKFARRREHHHVADDFKKQFLTGRLLAKIASRPGQTGRADGVLLEGPEFNFYQKKIKTKKGKKH
mmetsp:Transcript_13056/g.19704  ORF Transcript_13056/g.19704 Transcript_13056/m.19704 type:complete len:204 (-) Transcript_13056:167-778(-)|eukprot:CAMPEP_0117425562 /NCGR_PEP_ID=MMETSP0758-20121206/5818_1 /TAXON_ID=63605 /ORGANISM="Percolomonas cosmopolitus, Strain AE-1 (ATCC 50343)" /LENGTH=203 /DNA_ID=CAMNT_0005210139 /DNA_START=35 /DNA_END=646 /DNA_ORIENTATION=+